MSIGFKTPEDAQMEIDRLKKAYEKWKDLTTQDIIDKYLAGKRIPTSMLARDYKVEPIRVTLL